MYAMVDNGNSDDYDDDDISMQQLAQLLYVGTENDLELPGHVNDELVHNEMHDMLPDLMPAMQPTIVEYAGDDDTRALAANAIQVMGTPGAVGQLLSLPPLPANINPKQRQRIEDRRRTKIRLQSARVLLGYTQHGSVSCTAQPSIRTHCIGGP